LPFSVLILLLIGGGISAGVTIYALVLNAQHRPHTQRVTTIFATVVSKRKPFSQTEQLYLIIFMPEHGAALELWGTCELYEVLAPGECGQLIYQDDRCISFTPETDIASQQTTGR
jgi:hypothetical protein